uniref:Uncharacterized protein n=1 Tax=Cacopsylla melanoneura TaxID=428564 RepID=A0A8D9AQY3_9HEMI
MHIYYCKDFVTIINVSILDHFRRAPKTAGQWPEHPVLKVSFCFIRTLYNFLPLFSRCVLFIKTILNPASAASGSFSAIFLDKILILLWWPMEQFRRRYFYRLQVYLYSPGQVPTFRQHYILSCQ